MNIWHVKEEVPQEQGKQILVRLQDDCGVTVKVMSNVQEYLDEYYETSWLKWAYVEDLLKQEEIINKATENLEAVVEGKVIENAAMFEMASHNKEKVLEDTLKILKGEE